MVSCMPTDGSPAAKRVDRSVDVCSSERAWPIALASASPKSTGPAWAAPEVFCASLVASGSMGAMGPPMRFTLIAYLLPDADGPLGHVDGGGECGDARLVGARGGDHVDHLLDDVDVGIGHVAVGIRVGVA